MIQEKMNVLEQVGLSESNLSDNALNASFHSKVNSACVYTNAWHEILCLNMCLQSQSD